MLSESFWQGALAGYGIAIPVGAIAILIVDIGLRHGFGPGFMAGAGAATADFVFAILAAVAGQVLVAWLAPWALALQIFSGGVLIALGGYGLWRGWSRRGGASLRPEGLALDKSHWQIYRQFLGLTLLNPMTIAYFGALILGGSSAHLTTALERLAFVVGAGLASWSWQSVLAVFGAVAHRGLPPSGQRWLSLIGNGIVLALGVRILWGVWGG